MEALTERGLQRRLKRRVWNEVQHFSCTTDRGLEDLLAKELEELGAECIARHPGSVVVTAPFRWVYGALLRSRIARCVFWQIRRFEAEFLGDVYNEASKIPWELYVGFAAKIHIKTLYKTPTIRNAEGAKRVLWDALSNRMAQLDHKIELDVDAPLVLSLRVEGGLCQLSFEAGNGDLGRRFYNADHPFTSRKLRSTLASGLLSRVDSCSFPVVFDPFCREGLFLIEQALFEGSRGIEEVSGFSFRNWAAYKVEHLRHAHREAEKVERGAQVLIGADRKTGRLEVARAWSEAAEVKERVTFLQRDWKTFESDPLAVGLEGPGLIISEMPRPPQKSARGSSFKLVKRLKAILEKSFAGWTVALLIRPGDDWFKLDLLEETYHDVFLGSHPRRLYVGKVPKD